MGADGGIKITKISEIRENWNEIREKIIKNAEWYYNDTDYAKSYLEKVWIQAQELPDDIKHLDNVGIIKVLSPFVSCDVPYLFENYIITAEGDNIPDHHLILSDSLNGLSIETWT